MDAYEPRNGAQVLPILSNAAIIPAFFFALNKPRIYHLDLFFFLFTFFNSMLLHTCDQQGPSLCPNIGRWRELDYVTAQFGPAYIAVQLYPFTRISTRNMFFLVFATIHLILTELRANDWVSLGGFSVIGLAFLIRFNDDFRKERLFFTFFFAVIGLAFFYLDNPRVYDYTHTLWHVFAMIAYYMVLTARIHPLTEL